MRVTLAIIILLLVPGLPYRASQANYTPSFDGEEAFNHLVAQTDFGPRPPGSDNLTKCRNYIINELEQIGWTVSLQTFTYMDTFITNIVAEWPSRSPSFFVVGAHYDTRPYADQESDPTDRTLPVLGANDGASGASVLLELARVLPESIRGSVEFVFFDAEDSGNINGWDWIVGSTYYVDQLD